MNKILMIVSFCALAACSSNQNTKLLPDEGVTTLELMTNQYQTSKNTYVPIINGGNPIFEKNINLPNRYSNTHLAELEREFRQIPNPQILAYVYPHFAGNGLPVPGYFTVFRLYDSNRYAISAEGIYEQ